MCVLLLLFSFVFCFLSTTSLLRFPLSYLMTNVSRFVAQNE